MVNSVLWDVMSEQLELISSAFKVIETQRPETGLLPVRPYRAGTGTFQNPLHAVMPGRASGPCCHRNMQTICRYTASQKYTVVEVELSRATLGRWTGAVAELLEPLYGVLRQYVLMRGKVHADDIPVPVQEPGSGKTGQPGCGSTSVMTVTPVHRCPRQSGSRTVRTGKVSIHGNHLAGYSGVLQADAYGGYRALYESGRITEAACMAHARRKIHDVHARAPTYITTRKHSVSVNCMPSGRGPGLFSRTASDV
ncbi:IS66 family transposase [Escherichia coli]|nr:IS66 family transposase [Escherichia coli]